MHWFADRRMVVPFDFSEESLSAVDVAVKLAEVAHEIHVLHVLPPLVATEPGVVWGTVNNEERCRHALAAMSEMLAQRSLPEMQLEVRVGDPGHVIVDLASQVDAGLIVISSRGRTGISRVLIGSVAERVVRLAHCPVLVLKKK